jgi:DNA gyrase/topoisomerase IV subunit B
LSVSKLVMSLAPVLQRHALRYGKLMITTDADDDGNSIVALLVNFFHRFWHA